MEETERRVLVVDDDPHVSLNLSAFLEDEGFVVRTASSAEEALEVLANEEFDASIIDMRLPGKDGNTLILEAHELRPEMSFIIHTASTRYNLTQEVLDIGVHEKQLFIKPVSDMSVLSRTLEELMGDKEVEQ